MLRAQIYDVAEEYTRRGYERSVQGVRAYGMTKDGRTVSVLVTDIPHEIYVDPKNEEMGMMDLMAALNRHLLKKQSKCVRTDCASCAETQRAPFPGQPPSYQTCIKDRFTDQQAVCSVEQVMRKPCEGYCPEQKAFWKFGLTRSYYAKPAKQFFESRGLDVYECCPDPVQSFVFLKNFAGYEWYEWPEGPTVKFDDFKQIESLGTAPLRNVCFDIEVIGESNGTYNEVKTSNGEYIIARVCADDDTTRTSYVLGEYASKYVPSENETVKRYACEKEMLREVRADLLSAQVWSGYNSDGYDIPYVFRRGKALGDAGFCNFSGGRTIRFAKKEKESFVFCPGILFVDYCSQLKADNQESPLDYKLETVCKYFDLPGKKDMPYDKIHAAFYGSVEDKDKLTEYCAEDVAATKRVAKRMDTMTQLVAKCIVKRVRPQDELYRGSSFVLHRKFKEYLRKLGYVMFSQRETYDADGKKTRVLCDAFKNVWGFEALMEGEGYDGGFVRDTVSGIYPNYTVVTFDFKSLYPSLIRTYNMCFTTLLPRPGTLPPDKEWTSTSGFAFAQHEQGVIPLIMDDMVTQRNLVRKKIVPGLTAEEKAQLNALQTQYKVVANSLYGQCGAPTSLLANKAIAKTTCQRGQELAQLAAYIIDSGVQMPVDWNSAKRAEYLGRMRRFEESLTEEQAIVFVEKRARYKDVFGIQTIAGDTDSLMVNLSKAESKERALEWGLEIKKYINVESGILGTKGILEMAVEGVSKGLWMKKKMYYKSEYGVNEKTWTLEDDPHIKMVGLHNRNKSPCALEFQSELLAMGMNGEDISKTFEAMIQSVALGKVPITQMIHTSVLNKEPEQYASGSNHAVAAMQLRAAGKSANVGDRVGYYKCLLLNNGHKKCDNVVADELVGGYDLDWAEYTEETIKALAGLEPLIKNYEKLSRVSHYHLMVGSRRTAPALLASVNGPAKQRVGPMDGFVSRSDAPRKKARVHAARGREFSDIMED